MKISEKKTTSTVFFISNETQHAQLLNRKVLMPNKSPDYETTLELWYRLWSSTNDETQVERNSTRPGQSLTIMKSFPGRFILNEWVLKSGISAFAATAKSHFYFVLNNKLVQNQEVQIITWNRKTMLIK